MATIMVSGRVVNDLELKETEKGAKYSRFSIVENERKKVSGEYKDVSNYYSVIAFGNLAENLIKAKVKKGSGINIIGRAEAQSYINKEGESTASISIIMFDWYYLPLSSSKQKDNKYNEKSEGQQSNAPTDDDLPF